MPSVFHSSRLFAGLEATKYIVSPMTVNCPASESSGPGLMSLTSVVPAGVPSVLYSSRPVASLVAPK